MEKTIHTIVVEDRKLEVYYRNFSSNGFNYCVYKDKIWEITGTQGVGISHKKKLERPLNKETIWIISEECKELLYITKPTGYIAI